MHLRWHHAIGRLGSNFHIFGARWWGVGGVRRELVSSPPFLVLGGESGRRWATHPTLLEASATFFCWVARGERTVRVVDANGSTICWRDVERGSAWTDEVSALLHSTSPDSSMMLTMLELLQLELEVLSDVAR